MTPNNPSKPEKEATMSDIPAEAMKAARDVLAAPLSKPQISVSWPPENATFDRTCPDCGNDIYAWCFKCGKGFPRDDP